MPTIKEMRQWLAQALATAVPAAEAAAMADIIIEDVKGYKPVDLVLYGHRELLPDTQKRMVDIAQRVIAGEPLQYAIGTARFRGRDFKVTPSTLIPRPETAQLVDMIVDDYRGTSDARLLDVGTGSGCIAVSLALDLPFAQVEGIDISADAVAVAKANAEALKAKARFAVADALDFDSFRATYAPYDVIVSNPPYVLESERDAMDARVKDHEPAQALFVPDADPLLFYSSIAAYGRKALTEGGRLYFEINPLAAADMERMLRQAGYADIDIIRDYKGNLRFARCRNTRN